MCNLVIIFDSQQRGNEKRKNALIEVVQKCGWQIQEYDPNNTNQINWQNGILFLCHYTDLVEDNEVEQLFFEPNESLKKLMITYTDWKGGNEGKKEAEDISENSHKILEVGGERLYYNLEDLLNNYANSQEWDIKILNEPYNNNIQFIPALSLLCQGYLAIHAEYQGQDKNWQNDDIANTIQWWTKFRQGDGSSLTFQTEELTQKIKHIQTPSWWLTCLEVENNQQQKQDFYDNLLSEWLSVTQKNNFDQKLNPLLALLERIGLNTIELDTNNPPTDNETIITPKMVAEAYEVITSYLT